MAGRKGELRVKVISAQGLRDTALFGIQDPYVQLDYGSLKVKTAVHRDGGTSPVWNENIKLSTTREAPTKLLVTVKNSNTLRDQRVGSTEIDLSDVFDCHHEEVSAPLFTRDGRQRGEVRLSISFQPADSPQFTPHTPPVQPQKEQTNATPTSDPISTSGACSDSKPATPARSGQLPNTHFKKPPLHNQDEFGPLGKGLMALSMTHVSPTKLNAHADSASSEQQSSASTTVASPMRDVTVRPNRGSHAPAVSSSQAGSILSPDATMQHAASSSGAPPKRNIYPELIEDNDDPHSWTVSSQPMYSNADRGSCVAQTSEHGGAAWQQNGDVSSESYSSHEVYAHQYGEQGGTAQQRSNAAWVPSMQSMPHGYAGQHYQYSQSFTVGQVSSVRQDSDQQLPATQPILSGQGSRAPFRASQFHPLGTTPLHDGQLIQQPQQQHMQQVQHVSNGFGHNSSQPYAQQQGDALMAIPAWRLMGTSPLQDGNVFYNGTAAEQPISSAAQPLTYASMAVKSWSTQVKNPLVSHRTSHHDGAQSDLDVALSAPSAPSLPYSEHASGHRSRSTQPDLQPLNKFTGESLLPNHMAQTSLPFSGVGTYTQYKTGDCKAVI